MRHIWILALAGVLSWGTLGAWAQSGQDAAAPPTANAQEAAAPPTSNAIVARLSAISGSVSTQRGDTGAWSSGALNTPLVSGDKVAAGEGARAEVELDYADVLRLDGNSQANLANLDRNQIQVQLASGRADYVVLKGAQAPAEVDTPNVAVHPSEPGVYRIEVVSPSETQVIVREGEANISTPQGSTLLKKGQLITIEGATAPEYKISDAPSEDAWDKWNQTRDVRLENSPSLANTNQYYTGIQDLDGNGYWTAVPGYGQVWVPYQGPTWSPYSDGQWNWEPYYGWTWVGFEPWGWAPYHYGRWFLYNDFWAWWPGPVTPFYEPIWAPAYVNFFGWGGGFGFGFGYMGWLPIGPFDPFLPWWGGFGFGFGGFGYRGFGYAGFRGPGVVRPLAGVRAGRMAYSNLDRVGNNARIRSAMMGVSSAEFARGGATGRVGVTAADLRGSEALRGTLPVTPTRASLSAGRPMAHSAASGDVASHFFGSGSRTAQRTSFEQERSQVASRIQSGSYGAAHSTASVRAAAAGQSSARNAAAGRDNTASGRSQSAGASAGWQRFNGNAASSEARSGQARSAGESSRSGDGSATRPGFQRFTPQRDDGAAGERGGYGSGEGGYRGGDSSRQPLQMGHSIVEPRSSQMESAPRSGGYSGGYSGGGGGYGGGHAGGGGYGGHGGGGGHR